MNSCVITYKCHIIFPHAQTVMTNVVSTGTHASNRVFAGTGKKLIHYRWIHLQVIWVQILFFCKKVVYGTNSPRN